MKKTIFGFGLITLITTSAFAMDMMATGTMMDKMEDKMMKKDMMMKCLDLKKSTRMEIKKFQKENGIISTGFIGKLTKAKLAKMNCGKEVAAMKKDIVDTAVGVSDLSTLVTAVKAADLVTTLKTSGPFTVFAPTNAAFAKLATGTVENLLKSENKSALAGVLTYHVVAGKYTADMITNGLKLKTVNGKDLNFTVNNGKVMINGNSTVVSANVETSNGVVHVIDTVLLP